MEGHDVARKDRRFGLLLGEGGFSNLNIASWVGNYELDAVIEG